MDALKVIVQRAVRAKAAEQGQYSLRQLADDSGMHWTHVSNVLRGKRRPTRDVLEAWAVALSPHLDLDEALGKLESVDPQAAEVVKLRVFAGMTIDEVAEVQGVSARTAKRTWAYARAWLGRELGDFSER